MWQDLIVLMLVAVAAAWLGWTLILPRRLQQRLRHVAGRPAPGTGSACRDCGGCGGGCGKRD